MTFSIKYTGLDELRGALKEAGGSIDPTLKEAGLSAVYDVILKQYGTPGNYPEYSSPYYQRGSVAQGSERMGTQYSDSTLAVSYADSGTHLLVGASYADCVVGNPPAAQNARVGWRSLLVVVMDQIQAITAKYQEKIDQALQKAGLK